MSVNMSSAGEVSNSQSSMCLNAADDGFVGLTSDCYVYSRFQEHVSSLAAHRPEMLGVVYSISFLTKTCVNSVFVSTELVMSASLIVINVVFCFFNFSLFTKLMPKKNSISACLLFTTFPNFSYS